MSRPVIARAAYFPVADRSRRGKRQRTSPISFGNGRNFVPKSPRLNLPPRKTRRLRSKQRSRETATARKSRAGAVVRTSLRSAGTHKKRFAVKRKSNTDPDVTATAIMSSALRTAVDSTIGKRLTEGTDCFARPPLDLDRFFTGIMFTVDGSGRCGLTLTLPCRS